MPGRSGPVHHSDGGRSRPPRIAGRYLDVNVTGAFNVRPGGRAEGCKRARDRAHRCQNLQRPAGPQYQPEPGSRPMPRQRGGANRASRRQASAHEALGVKEHSRSNNVAPGFCCASNPQRPRSNGEALWRRRSEAVGGGSIALEAPREPIGHRPTPCVFLLLGHGGLEQWARILSVRRGGK